MAGDQVGLDRRADGRGPVVFEDGGDGDLAFAGTGWADAEDCAAVALAWAGRRVERRTGR